MIKITENNFKYMHKIKKKSKLWKLSKVILQEDYL